MGKEGSSARAAEILPPPPAGPWVGRDALWLPLLARQAGPHQRGHGGAGCVWTVTTYDQPPLPSRAC